MQQQRLAFILTALCLISALTVWLTGWDESLTFNLYNPRNSFAWFLREWSGVPIMAISLTALVFLALPWLRDRFPHLRQHAAVWVLVIVLGVGLVNQTIIKDAVERPRPRDDILVMLKDYQYEAGKYVTTAPTVALTGRSMPSGHAGMAFMLLVPAFALWQRRRKLAIFFLTSGLAYGALIGWARIVLGAHYASDILVAAAINIAAASLFTRWIQPQTRIRTLYPLSFILLAGSILLYTKEVKTNLTWQGELTAAPTFDLPCTILSPENITYPVPAQLTVNLRGSGLPETWIYLHARDNHFSLRKIGIHHHLTCTGKWTFPLDSAAHTP